MSSMITTAVRGLVKPSQAPVVDYTDDFDRLWAAVADSGDGDITEGRCIVICGIDAPNRSLPDDVAWEPFEKHLHALAWAASWKLRYPESTGRVLLIGSSEWGAESPLGKLALLFAAQDANGHALIGGVSWLRDPDATSIKEWLSTEAETNQHGDITPARISSDIVHAAAA